MSQQEQEFEPGEVGDSTLGVELDYDPEPPTDEPDEPTVVNDDEEDEEDEEDSEDG